MKLARVTYLGALSRINAILIPRISAHPPILSQCKLHRPWALFREGTVILYLEYSKISAEKRVYYVNVSEGITSKVIKAALN